MKAKILAQTVMPLFFLSLCAVVVARHSHRDDFRQKVSFKVSINFNVRIWHSYCLHFLESACRYIHSHILEQKILEIFYNSFDFNWTCARSFGEPSVGETEYIEIFSIYSYVKRRRKAEGRKEEINTPLMYIIVFELLRQAPTTTNWRRRKASWSEIFMRLLLINSHFQSYFRGACQPKLIERNVPFVFRFSLDFVRLGDWNASSNSIHFVASVCVRMCKNRYPRADMQNIFPPIFRANCRCVRVMQMQNRFGAYFLFHFRAQPN